MNLVTTYTVRSKEHGFIWLFKYNLNGSFKSFEIIESELSQKQIIWLFASSNFPATEAMMQTVWMKLVKNFEIIKAEPILDFETLWELYGYKQKKEPALKAFNKLPESDKIKCFMAVPKYKKHLSLKPHIDMQHLVFWINQQRFNDEY